MQVIACGKLYSVSTLMQLGWGYGAIHLSRSSCKGSYVLAEPFPIAADRKYSPYGLAQIPHDSCRVRTT